MDNPAMMLRFWEEGASDIQCCCSWTGASLHSSHLTQ